MRVLRECYEEIGDFSGVSLTCYEKVTDLLRGSCEETAAVEFSLIVVLYTVQLLGLLITYFLLIVQLSTSSILSSPSSNVTVVD